VQKYCHKIEAAYDRWLKVEIDGQSHHTKG
jgi:hypothetical protein